MTVVEWSVYRLRSIKRKFSEIFLVLQQELEILLRQQFSGRVNRPVLPLELQARQALSVPSIWRA
jgi:hypothetical protein